MRTGWSLKEAAAVLGIHERRVTQALDPALRKIATLWRTDATRTMNAILETINDLEPMTEAEIRLREQMLEGRADRNQVNPRPR